MITGAEPRALKPLKENHWREPASIFDWARSHTLSVPLSCLATHAVVFLWDEIVCKPLARKLSGLYPSRILRRHYLVERLGAVFATPHSRCSDLDGAMVTEYATPVHSDEEGVDLFVTKARSLLVFLQGHPEYALAREYRRNLARFLVGTRETPSNPPGHYFSPAILAELQSFATRTEVSQPGATGQFPKAALSDVSDTAWGANPVRLYRNLLEIVAESKYEVGNGPTSPARWRQRKLTCPILVPNAP